MEINKKDLERRYAGLSDSELLRIFMEGGLSDLAHSVLKHELTIRKLAHDQTKDLSSFSGQVNEEIVNNYFTLYYQSKAPNLAPAALEYYILNQHPTFDFYASYFLAKIAEDNPKILRDYRSSFYKVPHHGKLFILEILEWLNNDDAVNLLKSIDRGNLSKRIIDAIEKTFRVLKRTDKFDILKKHIKTGMDLDLLWAEFFYSGEFSALLRIIDTLEMEDRVRKKLEGWSKGEPSIWFLSKYKLNKQINFLKSNGILLDKTTNKVKTAQDLDCFISMEGCNPNSERLREWQSYLPFRLNQEDINHIGLKATAKWSLASNANEHPIVKETIVSESIKREERCRIALSEIYRLTEQYSNYFSNTFAFLSSDRSMDNL